MNTQTVSETNAPEFQWAQLTTPDFALYIKHLRAFGTPEMQVRDIIFGAVDARYRPRRAALRPPVKKMDTTKFWERRNFGGYDRPGMKEQREQLRALQQEENELLRSLFGPEVYQERAKESGGSDWLEKSYGFVPKELREKVSDLEQQMNEAKQEVYAANDGYFNSYEQADLRKVEKKIRDELAKILTPEQLREWELRYSDTANQLKNDLSAFDPNEDEFRALFQYRQTLEALDPQREPDSDAPEPTAAERQALSEKQQELEAQLAQAVGTNRAAEYKLEQDYAYRSLIDSGVAKESVFKLDEMKQQAEAAAQQIRGNKSLTPDQRTAALSDIRVETQNSINGLLGDKFAKRYSGQGGWWLDNIAPRQPAPAPQ